MSKFVWLLSAALFSCVAAIAQDSISIDRQLLSDLNQQMQEMQRRTNEIHAQIHTMDSLGRELRYLEKRFTDLQQENYQSTSQVERLKVENQQNTEQINNLMRSRELDARGKYEVVRQNLIGAAAIMQSMNSKINTLKSFVSSNSLDNLITDLNNPQNNRLGFTLDKIIVDLVNQHIQPKDKKNFAPILMKTIEDITKSPLIATIPGAAPALSISNTVITLLRSTSLIKDDVDPAKIKAFEAALNKYVQYYLALNEATQQFNYAIHRHQDALGLMQQRLHDHVVYFGGVMDFKLPQRSTDEKLGEFLNRQLMAFSVTNVEQYFNNLERSYLSANKTDYERILVTNSRLKEANNRVEELVTLVNQYEFEFNEYLNSMQVYGERVLRSLDIAKENMITSPVVADRNKAEFTRLQTQAIADIKASIFIKELVDRKQSLPYSMRVL